MNNNINLLEKRKTRMAILRFSKLRLLRTIAVSMLFLVSTVSVIIFILISLSPLPQLKRQEQQAILTLSQFRDDMVKISLINERTDVIEDLLSKRRSFDTTLEALQNKLPSEVNVETLSINKNTLSVSVSSKSLALLDTFINNILSAVQAKIDFSKVTLTSLSSDNQTKSYLLSLTLVTM